MFFPQDVIIHFWQRHSSAVKGHLITNTAGWNHRFKFLTTLFRRKRNPSSENKYNKNPNNRVSTQSRCSALTLCGFIQEVVGKCPSGSGIWKRQVLGRCIPKAGPVLSVPPLSPQALWEAHGEQPFSPAREGGWCKGFRGYWWEFVVRIHRQFLL